MQIKYVVSGSNVYIAKLNENQTFDKLMPMVYSLEYSQTTGYFLSIIKDQLELPEKIYGKIPARVEKCITTYTERDRSTGILLTGDI